MKTYLHQNYHFRHSVKAKSLFSDRAAALTTTDQIFLGTNAAVDLIIIATRVQINRHAIRWAVERGCEEIHSQHGWVPAEIKLSTLALMSRQLNTARTNTAFTGTGGRRWTENRISFQWMRAGQYKYQNICYFSLSSTMEGTTGCCTLQFPRTKRKLDRFRQREANIIQKYNTNIMQNPE